MMCADLVDLRWREKSGRSRRLVANLEDISTSGACLQVDVPIPLLTVVRISYPLGEYHGVVRYCQHKDFGHLIGVHFEDGSQWSKSEFKPLHLLDPRMLIRRATRRPAQPPHTTN
jgi:hypothetical protein